MSTDEQEAGADAARAEQRPSSVLELVGSDRAMSIVLSFLGPALPTIDGSSINEGQFSGQRLREALALGRLLPGVCVGNRIKVGPAGAALLATDACLGGLQLASGSSWPHVLDALKLNTGVRKLGLHWAELNDGDVALLCEALVSLVDVDVSGEPGARAMVAQLSPTASLQELNLRNCKLQPGDVAVLAGALATNAFLRVLDLGENNVGESGGRALAAALEINSTLHVLRMKYAFVGDAEGIAIGAALATNTGLFQLDLSGNHLGEASGLAMAAALTTNTTLWDLNLSANWDFRSGGAVALFGALRSNHTLLKLDMTDVGLDHASGVALADMVRENSSLRVLDLSENRLGRAWDGSGSCSWPQVLAALKHNSGLHTLCLENCELSADDGQALAEALQQRRSGLLRKLEISSNPDIGDTSCGAIIAACLKPGSSVASFDNLGSNVGAGHQALQSLAEGLRQDNKLEELDLLDINGTTDGENCWPELFAAFAVNTRVHALSLRGCDLTAADGWALASAIEQRPAGLLRELSVNGNKGLGDDACSAIIDACLKPGSALRKFYIDCSGAGLAVTLSLAGCLRANRTLEVLYLGGMGTKGNWPELFGALAVNSGVRTLNIKYCGLKQRDVEALAAALRTNRVLRDLRLYDADLGDNCGQIMAGGLAANTTLRKLHLYGRSYGSSSSLSDAAACAFCRILETNSALRELSFGAKDIASPVFQALKKAGRAKGCQIMLL